MLIGSCEKAKVPCTGQMMSARSIYSWSIEGMSLLSLVVEINNHITLKAIPY